MMKMLKPLLVMVRLAGFEPATCGLEVTSLEVTKCRTVKDFRRLAFFEIDRLC